MSKEKRSKVPNDPLIAFAETLKERLQRTNDLDDLENFRQELMSDVDETTNRYLNGSIGQTAFLVAIKDIFYSSISKKIYTKEDLLLLARRELSQTLIDSSSAFEIESRILSSEDKNVGLARVRDDLIHHWHLTVQTVFARGSMAKALGNILMVFLCLYLLFPIIQCLNIASLEFARSGEIIPSIHKFIEVLSSFDQFKAIVLGGIGAIISIAISTNNAKELGVFELTYFSEMTFGRIVTGIWAALIMSLIFVGVFDGIVNPGNVPTPEASERSLLLGALQALALFSAGFSERFFDQLSNVASEKLGFEFSNGETAKQGTTVEETRQ